MKTSPSAVCSDQQVCRWNSLKTVKNWLGSFSNQRLRRSGTLGFAFTEASAAVRLCAFKTLIFVLLFVNCIGCKSTTNIKPVKPVTPPFPMVYRPLLVIAPTPTNPPVYEIPLKLPDFQLPDYWWTNHWRIMRSTNLINWEPVAAWHRGYKAEMFMTGPNCFLRLERYFMPAVPTNPPDNRLGN